jgi:hypothetical protein
LRHRPANQVKTRLRFGFRVLTIGFGSAIAFGDAFAHSQGSRLFSLKLRFISQSSVVVFNISGLGSFSRILPSSRVLPDASAHFVRLSATEFQVRLFSSLQLVVAATGLRTRSRHACDFLSRLNHLAPGQPPLLAARSPEATGLASSLIDCFFSQSSGVVFNIAGLRKFLHAACLAIVTFPLRALFLSAFQRLSFRRIQFFSSNSARAALTVLIRSSNQSLFWQLRFIQARNLPELLDSTRNGFSSPLAADSSFAFGARERARRAGEFCLRCPPFGWFKRFLASAGALRLPDRCSRCSGPERPAPRSGCSCHRFLGEAP